MKAKNALGHYTTNKEAAENRVHRKRFLPILFCFILAIVIWLFVVNFADTDYRDSSFFHPTPRYSSQTQTE